MDYKKIYCDKWKAAYTSNTVDDSDGSCVELRWKDVPLGELFCGPSGVVFTKLYRFKGDPELTKIQAFPGAEKEFNALLKNVEILEYICQLWEEVGQATLKSISTMAVSFMPGYCLPTVRFPSRRTPGTGGRPPTIRNGL